MSFIDTIIEAERINKIYCRKDAQVHAVKNADITLSKNRFYAVMGHSGSGKTTFLQMLGLLDGVTSGSLLINGEDVSALTEKDKAKLRMKVLGFVFQSCFLNPKLKAYENVMLPMYVNNEIRSSAMKPKAMALLEAFGLSDRAQHYPGELSGGEQQRVALARALANDPDCIFADEPTGNLDAENEAVVFDYLKRLSKSGKCVLVVSHNEIVKEYADELFLMEKGMLERQM